MTTLQLTLPTPNFRPGYLASAAAVSGAVILLIASAWLARSNLVGMLESDRLGEQISEARLRAEKVLSTLKDAETGQRGYLLTRDPAYLEPYDAERAACGAAHYRKSGSCA